MAIPAPVLMSPAPVEMPPLKRKKRREVVTLGNLDTQTPAYIIDRIRDADKLRYGSRFTAAWKEGKRRKIGKVYLQYTEVPSGCNCCMSETRLEVVRASNDETIVTHWY